MSKSSVDFAIGDCMWAKIGSYPYWPCVISASPGTSTYQKAAKKGSMVHVHFFGDSGKHSWVSSSALMPFKGLDDFNKNKFKAGDTTKIVPGFNVKSNLKPSWDQAVGEIELISKKDISKRMDGYYVLYPLKDSDSSSSSTSASTTTKKDNGSTSSTKKDNGSTSSTSSKRKSVSSEEGEETTVTKVVKSAPLKKAIKAETLKIDTETVQNGALEDVKLKSSVSVVVKSHEVKVPPRKLSKKEKSALKKGLESAEKDDAEKKAAATKIEEEVVEEPKIDITPVLNKITESLQTIIPIKKQLTLAKNLIEKITLLAVNNELTDKINVV